MLARSLILALALAACVPTAPAAQGVNAALLSAPPRPGQWSFQPGGSRIEAVFATPGAEHADLVIMCRVARNTVTFQLAHRLQGAHENQETTLRILTATRTIDFPAGGADFGFATVNAVANGAVPADWEKLSALAAPQQRFAVQVENETRVYPWDDAIAGTLAECR